MDIEILTKEISFFLDSLGIKVKAITSSFDNDLRLTIFSLRLPSYEAELFFENNNELLRDFGFIVKMIFQKKYHWYQDVLFDINQTNIQFIEQTKEKALIACERVLVFDKPYEFGYLNAFERMIIHSIVKKHPELISHSQGEGKERRLVIEKRTS